MPFYKQVPCVFQQPAGAVVTCGYLSVWENHQHPGGSVIQLYVAVFKSQNPHPAPDPIVYLVGGPGGHMLGVASYLFPTLIKPFLATRDFIFFDQRGTGYAKPALECPGISVQMDLEDPRLLACGERLRKEGIDLASYRSAESASDLNDLRKALGYTQWNLFGESYGTRLAVTAMRDVPQGIRSVILDATVRPVGSQPEDNEVRFRHAFATLFHGCEVDPACNKAYPDLPGVLEQAIARLNASPVTLVYDIYGEQRTVMVTGNQLIEFVYYALYDTTLIPELPRAIYAARDGKGSSSWQKVMQFEYVIEHQVSVGDYFSVACGDGTLPREFCQKWGGQGAAAIESQPVRSAIPALVLAGEYDPVTPPSYGQATASTLSHSFFFTFPGMGHTVIGNHACPTSMAMAFLDHPRAAPDAGCLAKMNKAVFVVPTDQK